MSMEKRAVVVAGESPSEESGEKSEIVKKGVALKKDEISYNSEENELKEAMRNLPPDA